MSHYDYIFTYRDPERRHSATQLASWILRVTYPSVPLEDALCIARCLLKGESWRPEYHMVKYDYPKGPCEVERVEVKDEYTLAFEARSAEYARGQGLAKRGSEGDAEAAIEFCKLFLAGAMANHCMG